MKLIVKNAPTTRTMVLSATSALMITSSARTRDFESVLLRVEEPAAAAKSWRKTRQAGATAAHAADTVLVIMANARMRQSARTWSIRGNSIGAEATNARRAVTAAIVPSAPPAAVNTRTSVATI